MRVLTLNGDGEQRGNTFAEYNATVAVTGDYTLCLRFNIIVFRLLTAVIYILDQKEYDLYRKSSSSRSVPSASFNISSLFFFSFLFSLLFFSL